MHQSRLSAWCILVVKSFCLFWFFAVELSFAIVPHLMRYFKILFFLINVFLLPFAGKAQVVFERSSGILSIGDRVGYFVDSSGAVPFDKVTSGAVAFKNFEDVVPNLGLLEYPLWLKITITNSALTDRLVLEVAQPLLDTLEFYEPKPDGGYNLSISGEAFPFSTRQVDNNTFVYDLFIKSGEKKDYYFRIRSQDKLELPIFIGTKGQVMGNELSKHLLFGIFFGIIFVMFFYNLFLYFTVRDKTYLYYVIYILAVGLVQGTIEGYTFQYLWPNNSFMATRAFFLFTALVNISGLEFVRHFLHTKVRTPMLDKVALGLYVVYGIAIVLACFGAFYLSYNILQAFAGPVSLYMLLLASVIGRQGYRPAKFFLLAWIPLIIGIIIYVFKDVGFLQYSTFTNYSITVGSALEVILLSFALADKITILQAEKRASQAEALRVSRENERIIREQNTILEAKVDERTMALKTTNDELERTLKELQEAETHLVESEKMASLGQLTAGIAHEINNPINFVSSNVSPLKRDVDMLLEMIRQMEDISAGSETPADKQRAIAALKQDVDFEYLQEEISYLLKGISDGASRTAEIVKGLRVFSRLDEDDLKRADVNEGLDSTLIIVNHLLNNLITVEKHYSGIPLIECYPGKLNQVFLNIMSNAIHAIHERWGDEPNGVLSLRTWSDEEHVYLSIKDNGTGMTQETKKKIFEPFFTTKEVGEGTGLGMSIVYNTIKKHNGSIQIVTALGEGTEFILTLPIIHQLVKA